VEIINRLSEIWDGIDYPFLIHEGNELRFSDIESQNPVDLSGVKAGDVVALIGDFNPASILTLLRLIDLDAILVPLTTDTREQHEYFFRTVKL